MKEESIEGRLARIEATLENLVNLAMTQPRIAGGYADKAANCWEAPWNSHDNKGEPVE